VHDFVCAEYAGLHRVHAFGTRTISQEYSRIDKGCKCIRTLTYKYIITKDQNSDNEELYNIIQDPFEKTNIVTEYPDKAQRLKEKLHDTLDLSYFGPQELPDSRRIKDRLRELGYI